MHDRGLIDRGRRRKGIRMPGVNVVLDRAGRLREREAALRSSLSRLAFDRTYSSSIPHFDDHFALGFSRHAQYPVLVFQEGGRLICVDGFIYSKTEDEIETDLRAIGLLAFTDGDGCTEAIRRFMLSTDGEYAVFIYDIGKGELLVFNDPLCRLPLYYADRGGELVVSRTPGFIHTVTGDNAFDEDSIFEYLLFGYPLQGRTLFRDVFRLTGGSVLRGRMRDGGFSVKRLKVIDYEERHEEDPGVQSHAEAISQMLHEAVRRRASPVVNNLLALSGGLDSRTVAGCLTALEIPFTAVTFHDYYGIVSPDVEYARMMAGALGVDWELHAMKRATGSDCLEMLDRLCGMNYLGVSFSVPLIRELMEEHGDDITLFTGDGGDRVLRDTRPVGTVRDIGDLARYVVQHNSVIPVDVVSRITGTPKEEFMSRLEGILESYPERDMKMKYHRFIFCERCPGWHFQGEERNRAYVRPVTPFYSIELFRYAMALPDGMKTNFRLYREVLGAVSPLLASISNPEWGFPITSRRLPLYSMARRAYFTMPGGLKRRIIGRLKRGKMRCPYDCESNFMRCLAEQIEGCPAIADHLSPAAVRSSAPGLDKLGLDHLFTLTSVIERLSLGRSSIARFAGQELL